ncbi:hypothetical protein [Marimonas arenosa]|uniref:Uncharacterized protein n=1 Tax=Marimonas arenosa TaxID=1795305 RepID=A0AAE3W9Z5_9RHOB|nr:hypothetical protein [Marimonas arenosa]MDQ2088643.1 hypothetical protein [Marimonas arenosa]
MQSDNVTAARDWANGYVQNLAPQLDDLLGPASWYKREHMQEALGISEENGVYTVPFVAAHALREQAQTDKAAHSLASRIVEQNRSRSASIPEPLEDIASGRLPRPKKEE